MVAGTNLGHAKSHNRRVVIEAIRVNGPLSRAEIARITALSSQTASNIVEELVAADFLIAEPTRKHARGQPAIPYAINPQGAYAIGLQLDDQLLIGVITDLRGTICARAVRPVRNPTPDEAMPALAAIVAELRATFIPPVSRLLGIGLSMPGPFGVAGRTLAGPPALPGWDDFPITEELERRTGLPVILENDATAAAIGEHLYGVAREARSFVFLFIGTGIGAGLFLDGNIYKGRNHNAGEVGHIVVVPDGLPCPCGKRGCLERYASLESAYGFFGLPADSRPEALLALPPEKIDAWLETIIPALHRAIDGLELLLDPEAIVLGGFMPPSMLERLAALLQPHLIPATRGRPDTVPRVLVGAAGQDTSVLGAAALPIFGEFTPQFDVLLKR